MKNVIAVIGANYGDEGKGLMTDYFAAKYPKSLVVRYNGGAQAGHTVQLRSPSGNIIEGAGRHVFSHLGSGTFAEASTYLGPRFIINPILFNKEIRDIRQIIIPKVYVSLNSLITTPYDMLLNQWIEQSRGINRHGSCGVGIHETIVRSTIYPLRISDLYSKNNIRQSLDYIRQEYVFEKLRELNISEPKELRSILLSEEFAGKFIDECGQFINQVQPIDTKQVFNEFETIIFEGAQGLLLDQDFGRFPYVTHSNTGLKNIVELLELGNIQKEILDICYVTRWYLTRHGKGPFPTEIMELPHFKVVEKTNVTNEWQGPFRYGWLDINDLHARIKLDMTKYLPVTIADTPSLAITCLDQSDYKYTFKHDNVIKNYDHKDFLKIIDNEFDLEDIYCSYGSTREDICRFL